MRSVSAWLAVVCILLARPASGADDATRRKASLPNGADREAVVRTPPLLTVGASLDVTEPTYYGTADVWNNVLMNFGGYFWDQHPKPICDAQGLPISSTQQNPGHTLFLYPKGLWPTGPGWTLSYRTQSEASGRFVHFGGHLGAKSRGNDPCWTYTHGGPVYDAATKTWTADMTFWEGGEPSTQGMSFSIWYDAEGMSDGKAIDPITDLQLVRPGSKAGPLVSQVYRERTKVYSVLRHGATMPKTYYLIPHDAAIPRSDYQWLRSSGTGPGENAQVAQAVKGGVAIPEANGKWKKDDIFATVVHAPSQIDLPLNKRWRGFATKMGVAQECPAGAQVSFRIKDDAGKVLYDSGPMGNATPWKWIFIDLTNITTLTLEVDSARPGQDLAAWMDSWFWPLATWKTRQPATYFRSSDGVIYEHALQIANETMTNPWVQVPTTADDDFVRQFAHLYLAGDPTGAFPASPLKQGLKLYVEYTNEAWNWGGPFWSTWSFMDSWGRSPCGSGGCSYTQYAERVKQISDIMRAEFAAAGKADQLVMVFAGQPSGIPQESGLGYIKAKYGDPRKFFDVLAMAPYFSQDNAPYPKAPTLDDVLSAYEFGQGSNMDGGSVSFAVAPTIRAAAEQATKWGMPLVSYEGGQSTYGGKVVGGRNLLDDAQHAPRMGRIYDQLLMTWRRHAGDGLFLQSTDIGYYGADPLKRTGYWGALGQANEVGSEKYDSLARNSHPLGDATLDHRVDLEDFERLKANFGSGRWWAEGDFNDDRVVDMADFWLLYDRLSVADRADAGVQRFIADGRNGEVPVILPETWATPIALTCVGNAGGITAWAGVPRTVTLGGADGPLSAIYPLKRGKDHAYAYVLSPDPSFGSSGPRHGTIDVSRFPSITYTANSGYLGIDDVWVAVKDERSGLVSNRIWVPINVEPWVKGSATLPARSVADAPGYPKGPSEGSPNGTNGWTYLYAVGTPDLQANTEIPAYQAMKLLKPWGGPTQFGADNWTIIAHPGCLFGVGHGRDQGDAAPSPRKQRNPVMRYRNPEVAGPLAIKLHVHGDERKSEIAGKTVVAVFANDTVLWSREYDKAAAFDDAVELTTSKDFSMAGNGDALFFRMWTTDGSGDHFYPVAVDATITQGSP